MLEAGGTYGAWQLGRCAVLVDGISPTRWAASYKWSYGASISRVKYPRLPIVQKAFVGVISYKL